MQEGTSWADEAIVEIESETKTETGTGANANANAEKSVAADAAVDATNTGQMKKLWSTIVSKKEKQLAKARYPGVSGNSDDLVIPHTNSAQATPLRRLGWGESSACGGSSVGKSSVLSASGHFLNIEGQELQHKSLVEPVFLAFNRVAAGSQRISLMQIAYAVVEALNDPQAVDAIQPMKCGWWIYVQTNADHERLVIQGLMVTGKHIPLRSEFHTVRKRTVKIMIRDLPLYAVDNEQVLESISEDFMISSEIFYGKIWHNGKPTSIRNGDKYFYVTEDVATAMPGETTIAGFSARIFKPLALTKYCHCGEVGHKVSDLVCPGRAPSEVAAIVEPIRGGRHPLSNLHACPEGCLLPDGQYDFPTAEHHYQFKWLHFHNKLDESYRVLEAETGFQVMKIAHQVLPDDLTKPE